MYIEQEQVHWFEVKENMILTWDRMGRETGVRCEVAWLGDGKWYNKEKSFTDERKDEFTEL